MANLETKYLGLNLRNPLIVASSGLTNSVQKIERLEAMGAAAVVLKSVFEEQIQHEANHLDQHSDYTEAADYLQYYAKENYLADYLTLLSEAKKAVPIPILGSISCVNAGEWVDFARRIEKAGADALELNIFLLPTRLDETAAAIEQRYLSIVRSVTSAIKIPVAVKLGSHFTHLLAMLQGIEHNSAKGVVMFNRYFEPDINIQTLSIEAADIFSTPAELRNTLRWIALGSAAVPKLSFAASTGVHTGEDALKVLLAGASVCELCTTVYRNGFEVIPLMLKFMEEWIDQKGFLSLKDVVGRLNYGKIANPIAFERTQFMKSFSSYE